MRQKLKDQEKDEIELTHLKSTKDTLESKEEQVIKCVKIHLFLKRKNNLETKGDENENNERKGCLWLRILGWKF